MRKISISIVFCVCLILSHAQTWQWAFDGGNSPGSVAAGLVINDDGNIFCIASYQSQITIDSVSSFGSSFGAASLAKFAANGDLLTLIPLYNNQQQQGLSFSSLALAPGGMVGTGGITGAGYLDTVFVYGGNAYMAKFNEDGRILWFKNTPEISNGVTVNNKGSIFIYGRSCHAVSQLDTFNIYNVDSPAGDYPKMFLAALDSNGSCYWVRQGYYGSSAIFKTVTTNNFLYVLGSVDTCAYYDTTFICNTGGYSSFLLKLNAGGQSEWLRLPQKPITTYYNNITNDSLGYCYLSGTFADTLNLDGYRFIKKGGSLFNSFVAQLAANNAVVWAAPIYSDSMVTITAQYTDAGGNTYVAGVFEGNVQVGTDVFYASGVANSFIARYNSAGGYMGAIPLTNATINYIAEDSIGNAVVCGRIGPGTVSSYFDDRELKSTAQYNFFIAKLSAITTGLSRISDDDHLIIYANPNKGSFNIALPDAMAYTRGGLLTIYNSNGLTIKSEWVDISNHALQVDLGPVTRGIYTVTLTGNQRRFTGKVVVQ